MTTSGAPGEVITIGLGDAPTDEAHLRMALAYGASQQAKVRLVVQCGYSPAALDRLIDRQLKEVNRALRVLPPMIEVQWPARSMVQREATGTADESGS